MRKKDRESEGFRQPFVCCLSAFERIANQPTLQNHRRHYLTLNEDVHIEEAIPRRRCAKSRAHPGGVGLRMRGKRDSYQAAAVVGAGDGSRDVHAQLPPEDNDRPVASGAGSDRALLPLLSRRPFTIRKMLPCLLRRDAASSSSTEEVRPERGFLPTCFRLTGHRRIWHTYRS